MWFSQARLIHACYIASAPKLSEARAGAIRKVECLWLNKWLKGKDVIPHTDAAKSYKCKIPGVVHDNVVRCKKKVKIHGKWKWQAPNYVRIVAEGPCSQQSRNSSDRSRLAIPQGSCPNQSGVPCRKCCTASHAPVGEV